MKEEKGQGRSGVEVEVESERRAEEGRIGEVQEASTGSAAQCTRVAMRE